MVWVTVQGGTTVEREEIEKVALKVIKNIKSELPEDKRTFGVIDFVLEEARSALKGLKVEL